MTLPATPSHLRLVDEYVAIPAPYQSSTHRHQIVARENQHAGTNPHLSPTDPRWVLAVRAYAQLEGATLSPERRQRLIGTAEHLGLRPFDANLIIAIVQDKARQKQALADAEPALRLITPASRPGRSAWSRWIGAIVLAIIAHLILIWWLLGGT